ncbi:MAG: hypothetical protein ACKVII_13990 [Planctomycetales bacterium]|jgi:hypothetical protein
MSRPVDTLKGQNLSKSSGNDKSLPEGRSEVGKDFKKQVEAQMKKSASLMCGR